MVAEHPCKNCGAPHEMAKNVFAAANFRQFNLANTSSVNYMNRQYWFINCETNGTFSNYQR